MEKKINLNKFKLNKRLGSGCFGSVDLMIKRQTCMHNTYLIRKTHYDERDINGVLISSRLPLSGLKMIALMKIENNWQSFYLMKDEHNYWWSRASIETVCFQVLNLHYLKYAHMDLHTDNVLPNGLIIDNGCLIKLNEEPHLINKKLQHKYDITINDLSDRNELFDLFCLKDIINNWDMNNKIFIKNTYDLEKSFVRRIYIKYLLNKSIIFPSTTIINLFLGLLSLFLTINGSLEFNYYVSLLFLITFLFLLNFFLSTILYKIIDDNDIEFILFKIDPDTLFTKVLRLINCDDKTYRIMIDERIKMIQDKILKN
jgi:hypothetical protein